MSDKLHDEIDDVETLAGEARDIVRKRMDELPEILAELARMEEAGEIEPAETTWGPIEDAMEIVAARVAADMNALTTQAAKQGIAAGRKRVTA